MKVEPGTHKQRGPYPGKRSRTAAREMEILSPADADLFRLSLPPIDADHIKSALRYRIPELYPAPPEAFEFDFIVLSEGAEGYELAVIVVRREVLERYRRDDAFKGLACGLQAVMASGAAPGEGVVVLWRKDGCELLEFRAGLFQRRIPYHTTGNPGEDATEIAALIPADLTDIRLVGARGSVPPEAELRSRLPASVVSVTELDELQHGETGRLRPLFPAKRRNIFTRGRRMILWSLLLLAAGGFLLGTYLRALEQEAARLRADLERTEREAQRERSLQNEMQELSGRLAELRADAPKDLYQMLSVLGGELQSDTLLLSLVADNARISLEGLSNDAFRLSQRLERHDRFTSVRLQRVVEAAGDPRDRFSLIMEYRYE